jgi:hypothetical protein
MNGSHFSWDMSPACGVTHLADAAVHDPTRLQVILDR